MIVYRLISPSRKSYIGKTKFNIEKRLKKHISNWKNKQYQSKLFNAFSKYGVPILDQLCIQNKIKDDSVVTSWKSNNWIVQILCVEQTEQELNEKEKYFIKYYDSINDGYNLCRGGEGGSRTAWNKGKIGIYSKETLLKMSISHAGKHHSEKTKNKISEIQKKIPRKIFSDERKEKISNALKGRIFSEISKQKMSKSHLGKCLLEETKKKLSQAHLGKISPNKGIKMIEEQKRKISKSLKQRWKKKRKETGILSFKNYFTSTRESEENSQKA